MALVASIQVLLDCSEVQLAKKLKQISEVLQSADTVLDVRTLDHHGAPLASNPCAEAFSKILHDSYSPGAAWSTERFVVPHGKVQLDPIELGCLEVRVPEGHGANQAAVDVRIHRTEEGVSVSLLPAGRADVPLSDQNRAELSFATSRRLQGFCPVPATEGMEGRLYDAATGRPLMGPALLVPARGRYDLAIALKGGGFHLTQLRVEDTFEAMARQGTCEDGSGVPQRMYFNDEGALIPESRVELRPLFQGMISGGSMDDSTKRAIRELLGARSQLLVDQSLLMANGHKLATQLLTELFRATPALSSVRIRFEFEWGDQDGMPVRRSLPMPVLKLDAGALQGGVLTALTHILMADDPLDAEDMEIQLSSHLEEMNFFEAIGSLLDAGQASASIELDRARALAPAEDTRVPAPHYH